MDLEERRRRRKKKKAYYEARKKEGKFSFGIGGDYHLTNRKDLKGRQRGFRRYSVKQKGPQTKQYVEYRLRTNNYKCYNKQCYLDSKQINKWYLESDFHSIAAHIFVQYKDINLILDDYFWGYKDILFCKIVGLTDVIHNKRKKEVFLDNYLEILTDSILDFYNKKDTYIKQSGFSFFTFVANMIPFLISINFHDLLNRNKNIILLSSDTEIQCFNYSPLAVHILNSLETI